MTEAEVRQRIDAVSAAMMPLLRGAFYAAIASGKKWHTPRMFENVAWPTDGQEKAPEEYDLKNGNQISWNETADYLGARAALPATLVGNPKANHHEFGDGSTGFSLNTQYKYGGKIYHKTIYHGDPQGNYKAHDWEELMQ